MSATREDLAWAAGLFEGEGSISLKPKTLQLQLASTDEDVVRKFCGLIGLGKVYGPYISGKPRHKPTFHWHVSGHEKCQAILAAFWGFLCSRRQSRAKEALLFGAKLRPYGGRVRFCANGHEFNETNTRVVRNGGNYLTRMCRVCENISGITYKEAHRKVLSERQREYYWKNRGAILERAKLKKLEVSSEPK